MKTIRLSIVAENQVSIEKARNLASIISDALNIAPVFDVTKYDKFPNSYKIDFAFAFENPENSIVESIEKTNRLCSPWIVKFDEDSKEVELFFNKTTNASYGREKLNTIIWANWEVG